VPLKQLDRAVRTEMGVEWPKARAATGGTVRGQVWEPMKPQYTRKDGTVVPAWGGVAKVRGKGLVKGKKRGKRPSTSRVTQQSVIGQDKGTLRSSIIASRPLIVRQLRATVLFIGANMPDYGKTILGHDNRNILRWTRKDLVTYRRIAVTYLRETVRKRGPR